MNLMKYSLTVSEYLFLYMKAKSIKNVPGVFPGPKAGTWCRICKKCKRTITYTGVNARVGCLVCNRVTKGCHNCRMVPTTFPQSEIPMSIDSELSQSKEATSDYTIPIFILSHYGCSHGRYEGVWVDKPFKRLSVTCSECGHSRLQNIPGDWDEFSFYCHKCGERTMLNFKGSPRTKNVVI